jgi:hypothetical protein
LFEQIVMHETGPHPGRTIDHGFLAEAMVFYGHVHLVTHRGGLSELASGFGPELLNTYLNEQHLTLTYVPNSLVVVTEGAEHQLSTGELLGSGLLHDARELYQQLIGKDGRGRRLASRLTQLVKEERLEKTLPSRACAEWSDPGHVQRSVAAILSALAPTYPIDALQFAVVQSGSGVVIDTNIDFAKAGVAYNAVVPKHVSLLTPALLLGYIANGRRDVEVASRYGSAEFATNAVSAAIVKSRIENALEKSSQHLQRFHDATLGTLRWTQSFGPVARLSKVESALG